MNKLLYILPILLLPFIGVAQDKLNKEPIQKEKDSFNSQIDLNIEVLATGASYKRRITNKLMIGFGLGFGYAITFGLKRTEFKYEEYPNELYSEETGLESYRLGLILEYKINKNFKYELKPEVVGITEVANFSTDMYFAIKNGFYVRLKGIEIGIDFVVGKEIYNADGNESWVYYVKPLNVKIPIKW